MTSNREGTKTAELLMEALGPNLRKLLKECPGNVFSKTTVYMITIQLVSTPYLRFSVPFTTTYLSLMLAIFNYRSKELDYYIN